MAALPGLLPRPAEFYQRDADRWFRQLRAEDPLHWYEPYRFWTVTKYADVQEISQRPKLFSSQKTQLFELVRAGARRGTDRRRNGRDGRPRLRRSSAWIRRSTTDTASS
jgi:cytochrome P450